MSNETRYWPAVTCVLLVVTLALSAFHHYGTNRRVAVATERLWAHPDDSAGRRHVGELIAQVRIEATALGQAAMLPVCDEVGPMANSAPTPQAVEILIGGFETLARLWRATQTL